MWKFQKPTVFFWRTTLLAVVVGAVSGALGAIAVWSSMLAYQARLSDIGLLPQVFDRRVEERTETGLRQTVARAGARSVVDIFLTNAESDGYLPDEMLGRGIVLTSDGWIITHRSVVDPRRKHDIRVGVGALIMPVDTLLEDKETGVLFLRLPADHLLPAVFKNVGAAQSGDWLLAVQGEARMFQTNVEYPMVRDASITVSDVLATYITITDVLPESYGGAPLLDSTGTVVAMVISDTTGAMTRAIPMTQVTSLFSELFAREQLIRPSLGVRGIHLTGGRDVSGGRTRGFLLSRDWVTGAPAIIPGSVAARADLAEGDVITKVNDVLVNGGIDFAELLLASKPNEAVELTVMRDDQELTISILLGQRDSGRAY